MVRECGRAALYSYGMTHYKDPVDNAPTMVLMLILLALYRMRKLLAGDTGPVRDAIEQVTHHVPIARVGPVHVQLWIDHLGNTSAVYGFRVLSADETVTHAEGRRVQVRLDPSTLRPAVIGPELREACAPLVRATASVGLDARTGR